MRHDSVKRCRVRTSIRSLEQEAGMIRDKVLERALVFAVGVFLAADADAQPPPQAPPASAPAKSPSPAAPPAGDPALEPRAIAILKASGDRLAAARTLSFTAVVSYESPSRIGPALVYTTQSRVTVQRPGTLRVIQSGDPASEFLNPEGERGDYRIGGGGGAGGAASTQTHCQARVTPSP